MREPRRLPAWLLIVVTLIVCAAAVLLERARLFPQWEFAMRWTPAALRATQMVPQDDIARGVPILALAMSDADLYGKEGILTNKLEHGRAWEREGSIAYYERGNLLFASGVGVRVHGGGSRLTSPRQGFRLYFRRSYGSREFAPGILFGPDTEPVRRLVVHNDVRRDSDGTNWYFLNPLAYDISRTMGAIAPETRPVRFYLNGEFYGPFVLTERFDERFFNAHWGYDDILLSQTAFNELWAWVQNTRPLTMANVGQHVDLGNLTRWFLATAFCATGDAYQGPGQFLDLTREEAGWFWVNWDMDQAFRAWNRDSYQYLLERVFEQRRGRNPAEPRAALLTRLIAEDADYRDFFKGIFLQVMNHHVTPAFLAERYQHYVDVGEQLGLDDREYLPLLKEFLEKRPAFFRLTTEQWLNTPPSQPLTLLAPEGVSLVIDNERVTTGYRGLYFPDRDIIIDVPPEYSTRIVAWRVNGQLVANDGRLTLRADRPTVVAALSSKDAPAPVVDSMPVPPPATLAAVPAAPWARIPAGSYWMGCVPRDLACDDNEQPRVQIKIAEPFEAMATEVTAGEFHEFARASSRQMPRQPEWYADATHPVVNVTWDEAQAFCEWRGGRLPTEEEWEYAARGGRENLRYPWGDSPPDDRAIPMARRNQTQPVGQSGSNGFGLYDVSGNVWELTSSPFRPRHDAPPIKDGAELRTIRGGSWDSVPAKRRLSARTALSRSGRHNLYVGFRCVRPIRRSS